MNVLKKTVALCLVLTLVVSTLLSANVSAFADDSLPGTASGNITVDVSATAASAESTSFGVESFARNNKGTSRAYEGRDLGYRYPMASSDAFAAMVFSDEIVVYAPAHTSAKLELDLSKDKEAQESFCALLTALDEANARGGSTLTQLGLPLRFINTPSTEKDGCTIDFGIELDEGYYYAIISPTSKDARVQASADPSTLALFMETGNLVAASTLSIAAKPEGFDAVVDFITNMDYRPFWVSLRTSLVAMIFVFVLGLAAARLSLKVGNRVKDVLDALFTIPMVLPPTVCGFLLLVSFGNSTAFGRWLIDHGIALVFSWPAAVIAASVVAFPLMYRTVRGAFEAQDPVLLDAARTLGWGEARIFFKLMLPLAWPSIAAGTVLAFARAMGEFGATLFVAGNYAGVTQTMPIAIYFQWMGGRTDVATFWVFVVILISFVVILFINLYARHTQKFRSPGGGNRRTPEDA